MTSAKLLINTLFVYRMYTRLVVKQLQNTKLETIIFFQTFPEIYFPVLHTLQSTSVVNTRIYIQKHPAEQTLIDSVFKTLRTSQQQQKKQLLLYKQRKRA